MTVGRWQTNAIITMVVLFTVVIGLLLADLDFISLDNQAAETAVAINPTLPTPTETVLPVVPIPTATLDSTGKDAS